MIARIQKWKSKFLSTARLQIIQSTIFSIQICCSSYIQPKDAINVCELIFRRFLLYGCSNQKATAIPFSAFSLRSCAVFVLISLIFDMWTINPHDIKLKFFYGKDSQQ
ncbi:hypothetical protein CFOL_v3_20781 [Cephalotus follicularis]|uniref:Uncharacterized protein n=1 Tax=Cephalotus follicularis TaxID=3775 RepID=A0A1Q3CAN5_CEPFO|nr:hypothetical protein CFOL_v3_20781 [Cephalotus follicularis]